MTELLWLFLIPFILSLVAFALPSSNRTVVLLSLIPLALLIFNHNNWHNAIVDVVWIPALGIHFHLAVDSLSLVFLYLTAIIIPISLTAVGDISNSQSFYGLVFLLQGLLIGFFTARDLALFTVFWESMLLPLYFIINMWGKPDRQYASLKFLIYMIAGSALMVAAVLFLYVASSGTFNIDTLKQSASQSPLAIWTFAIFMLAFTVKTPLFPFHGWLPDAYYQAPVAGTILLSAILSKAGIYGIARIGLGLFPDLMIQWSPLFLTLAIIGVFYGAFAAWSQNDYKRLIAYSSFSHVNFILIGLFVWSQTAQAGAILQALNHGITIAALFLAAGWLEERLGFTSMNNIGGLAKFMPHLCWVTLLFVLSSVALPGTNSFVGELMILFGLFGQNPWLAALLGLTVVFSVVYMLRFMQKTYFEAPTFFQERWVDLNGKEMAIALVLIALIIGIGVYPTPVLNEIMTTTLAKD